MLQKTPRKSMLRRQYTIAALTENFWTQLPFSRMLKFKLLIYFIPMIIVSFAIPQLFITFERSLFNNSGTDKMMQVSQNVGGEYLVDYTKTIAMFFITATNRLNIYTNSLVQSYYYRMNGIATSALSQPITSVCDFNNITACIEDVYESMNLNTAIKETYNRDSSLVYFTTSSYINFATIDSKAWLFILSFKTLDSYFRGTIGRLRGDSTYMSQILIFHNSGQVIASYPAMNITNNITTYDGISKITDLILKQDLNDNATIWATSPFLDYITNETMMYLVRGIKLRDDTNVSGGIAIGVSINSVFSLLTSTFSGDICSSFYRYVVAGDGKILYVVDTKGDGKIVDSGTLQTDVRIPATASNDLVNYMRENNLSNVTFSKTYKMYSKELNGDDYPLIFARLIAPNIKYADELLYFVTVCSTEVVLSARQYNDSEANFVRDFHWILDSILVAVFGFLLIHNVDLFTKEILSPIKQISAKFIEITQSAFNVQDLKGISFDDILIKEETEIKDFHHHVCDNYKSLIADETFLNEGEFQEHKNLYKNKVLKKIYEEKNVLKPIKALNNRIPEKVEDDRESSQEGFLDNMHETVNENITGSSKFM